MVWFARAATKFAQPARCDESPASSSAIELLHHLVERAAVQDASVNSKVLGSLVVFTIEYESDSSERP